MPTPIPESISVKLATDDVVGIMWGDRLVMLQPGANMMACRLADWSSEPEWSKKMYRKMDTETPLEAGWRPDVCVFCTQDVRMGPRQRATYDLAPQDFTVGCLQCAAIFVRWTDNLNGHGDDEMQVRHLGGK